MHMPKVKEKNYIYTKYSDHHRTKQLSGCDHVEYKIYIITFCCRYLTKKDEVLYLRESK